MGYNIPRNSDVHTHTDGWMNRLDQFRLGMVRLTVIDMISLDKVRADWT